MSRRALTSFRIGAWAWVITGAGHLAAEGALALRPADPEAAHVLTAMSEYRIEVVGIARSLRDLDRGMSFVMAAALIFGGVVCLLVARSAPDLVTRSRSLSGLALGASLVVLALSVGLLPAPPIVLFTVACAAFGWALAAHPAPADRPTPV
ncbi:LIC_13387 family protein, partial [Saccharothrix hoggarensis]